MWECGRKSKKIELAVQSGGEINEIELGSRKWDVSSQWATPIVTAAVFWHLS